MVNFCESIEQLSHTFETGTCRPCLYHMRDFREVDYCVWPGSLIAQCPLYRREGKQMSQK